MIALAAPSFAILGIGIALEEVLSKLPSVASTMFYNMAMIKDNYMTYLPHFYLKFQ